MSHYDIMVPEVWRKIITEKAIASTVFAKHIPVERYPFATEVFDFREHKLANEPRIWKRGTAIPISITTYKKFTTKLELYANGIEIPADAVDRVRKYGVGVDLIRREIDIKSRGMGLYLDKKISDAMVDNAGNTFTGSAWGTSWDNIRKDLARAIRECRVDNYEPTHLAVSPELYEDMIAQIPMAESWGAEVIREGRLPRVSGLDVIVSNNLTTATTAIVFVSNRFGVLYESYPLTVTDPKLIEELGVWRCFMYAGNGVSINVPNAICTITSIS